MLNENIKTIRKSKGLSQQELAVKLNVVRQTVSKWEQGLSVPDKANLRTAQTVRRFYIIIFALLFAVCFWVAAQTPALYRRMQAICAHLTHSPRSRLS